MNTPVLNVPSAVRSKYVIDFQLANSAGKPSLFISDNPTDKDRLVLTLTHRGTTAINFFLRLDYYAYQGLGDPSRSNSPYPFHWDFTVNDQPPQLANFTLSFRKGVLSTKTLAFLQPQPMSYWHGWTEEKWVLKKNWPGLTSPIQPWLIGTTETIESYVINFQCYYRQQVFRQTYDRNTVAVFGPGDSIKLVLPQFTAADGGDRMTQVLFSYMVGGPGSDPSRWLITQRLPLAVLRRPEDSQIPFSVALADTQPIVNDGVTRNTVSLQITNQLSQLLQLTPRGQAGPTTLTVSFDVSDMTEDSALTDIANAANIVCEPAAGTKWHAADLTSRLAPIPEFSFTTDLTSMAPQESLKIILSEIVSATAAQTARIRISYQNLPDPKYANGQLVATVQKVH